MREIVGETASGIDSDRVTQIEVGEAKRGTRDDIKIKSDTVIEDATGMEKMATRGAAGSHLQHRRFGDDIMIDSDTVADTNGDDLIQKIEMATQGR